MTTKPPMSVIRYLRRGLQGQDRLTSTTDGRGTRIDYGYDDAGRMIFETSPDGTVMRAYDAAGKRTAMSDPTGTTTWSYDNLARATEIASPNGTISYSYDAEGRRVGMALPVGSVAYSLNPARRVTRIIDWDGETSNYEWNMAGQLTEAALPNGIATTRSYDAVGRIDVVGYSDASGAIDWFDSTHDLGGNRTAVTSKAGTESYVLDDLNRVTDATYPNGDSTSYSYDSAGNRLSMTENGPPISYSYDVAGQLVSAGPDAASYDLAGNLTDLAGTALTWDAHGRVETVTEGAAIETYSYDGDGLRASITGSSGITPLLWDRTGPLPMIVSDGSSAYIHGPAAVGEGGSGGGWLLPDGLGSTRMFADATGTTVASYSFDAFGRQRSTSGSEAAFGYTGQWTDTTGLLYLRARLYDPATGRFLSRDAIQPNAPASQGWNEYAYAANNPTTWTDPSGNATFFEYALQGAGRGALFGSIAGLAGAIPRCSGRPDVAACYAANIAGGAVVGAAFGGLGGVYAGGFAETGLIATGVADGFALALSVAGACLSGGLIGQTQETVYAQLFDRDPDHEGAFLFGCISGLTGFGGGISGGGKPVPIPVGG